EVKNAEAAFTKAKEQYEIQVIQNESDIAQAILALELAELDLAKYVGDAEAGEAGEWFNELASAQETVTLRQEDLARAIQTLDASVELEREGFLQRSQLETDQLAKKRAKIQLEQAERDLALKLKYGNRRRLAELSADVATKRRDVDKTRKQAAARLTDFEAARDSSEYTLERERTQLAELRTQVSKSKIFAPEAGLMVYARERSRWGSGDAIEEGDEVRERQDIATIPRAGGMTVKASIHETKLKKVQVGQPCLVTVDAFPGRTFEGRVDFVAVMADSGSWRSNPNQRLYKADISLLAPTAEMRPGMSCSVEILVEDLEDVHYVPRQSVFMDGGDTVAFTIDGGEVTRTAVEIGLDNSKWVTVLDGLTEGQTVALAPPADFEPAPVPEVERPAAFPQGGRPTEAGRPGQGARPGASGRPSGTGRPGGGRPGAKSAAGSGGRPGARPTGGGRPEARTGSKGGAE
ncbi:MAG: efflux RND transporter periplasmic adaptor subunit, partial [Planctomycetota bacterium]|nr:efflux RND transporter periplasmic adaptor subunit [Planctomycetota bacterium]